MKRLMSHGHAILSTLAFFRVTHFICVAPLPILAALGPFLYSRPVADLLVGLQLAIQAAFVLLALAALIDWIRHRDSRRSHLALAFGSLAVLILISSALGQAGPFNQVLTDVEAVVFLLTGYALLMFRDSFIPLSVATRRAVTIGIAAVALFAIIVQLPADPQQRHGPLHSIAL